MRAWKKLPLDETPELPADQWVPRVSRRRFVGLSVVAGFAMAVQPVCAQTMIVTDTAGLNAGPVLIPAGDREIPGYYAKPAGGGARAIVLVVEEIFGVHEHIKDMCRRLAKQGYLAVAPELYSRLGDVSKIEDIQELLKVVNQAPDAVTVSDLDATATWAAEHGGDSKRLGITGWCRGGRTAWLYAAKNHMGLKAAVAWYGQLSGQRTEAMPHTMLDLVDELKAPVLGLYGGQDAGIPVAQVEAMKAAMKEKGKVGEFVVYPEAPHAFNADYRPSYREKEAKDGMQRLLAWFKKYGVA